MSSGTFTAESTATGGDLRERRDAAHLADGLRRPCSAGSSSGPPSASPTAGRRRGRRGSACRGRTSVQRPQAGRKEKTTWSPSLNPTVLGPTALTMPAPSWPPAEGVDADGDVAGGDVVVGVAQPGCGHRHLELALPGVLDLEVDDLVLARSLLHHCTASLHELSSCVAVDGMRSTVRTSPRRRTSPNGESDGETGSSAVRRAAARRWSTCRPDADPTKALPSWTPLDPVETHSGLRVLPPLDRLVAGLRRIFPARVAAGAPR